MLCLYTNKQIIYCILFHYRFSTFRHSILQAAQCVEPIVCDAFGVKIPTKRGRRGIGGLTSSKDVATSESGQLTRMVREQLYHLPIIVELHERDICSHCGRRTVFKCSLCNRFLCLNKIRNHFYRWHTDPHLVNTPVKKQPTKRTKKRNGRRRKLTLVTDDSKHSEKNKRQRTRKNYTPRRILRRKKKHRVAKNKTN